jgi:hypothetical protein
LEALTRDLEAAWAFCPSRPSSRSEGGWDGHWLIVIVTAAVLGWLYFSAKLRTLRLRVPPLAVPDGGDPPLGRAMEEHVSEAPSSGRARVSDEGGS